MARIPLHVQSPVDGSSIELPGSLDRGDVLSRLSAAEAAASAFRKTTISERIALCTGFIDAFESRLADYAEAITRQMGKPLSQAHSEFDGMKARTLAMCALAESTLSDEFLESEAGFKRFIRREPLGVVLNIAAWNYPLLVAVNVVVPAVLAGNAVLLKHAAQTGSVGLQFEDSFRAAGAPEGLVQDFLTSHEIIAEVLDSGRIDHVGFTGSVGGGYAVAARANSQRAISTGMELGGKDPAIVLPDADLDFTVQSLVDGAFYNAGQSCCAVERIYVPALTEARFVEAFVEETRKLRLGNPLEKGTSLGPVVNAAAKRRIEEQAAQARSAGARQLLGGSDAPALNDSQCYLAPHVLDRVTSSMQLMREESFGPIIGIQSYSSLDEAIALANDSRYGLTASVWTRDLEHAQRLGDQLQAGTVFANRADFVDPELPWSGVKDSGLGCTLSRHGLLALTRPKSFHLRQR